MGFSRQEYWSGLPFPSPPLLVTSHQRSPSLSKIWLVCSYLEFLALLTQTKSSVALSLRQLQVGCSHDTRSSWERQIVCLVPPSLGHPERGKLSAWFRHRSVNSAKCLHTDSLLWWSSRVSETISAMSQHQAWQGSETSRLGGWGSGSERHTFTY